MRTPGAARSTLASSDWPQQHISAMPGVHGGRRRSVRWLAWLLHGKPTGREGKRRRAHGGASGGDDEVGEALDAPNRWSRSPGTGDEDDDAPVDCGLLWSRASVCSSMGSGRSSGVWRGSEGVAVAAANGVGGDELRSGREGERAEEGERSGESERFSRGSVSPSGASSGEQVSRRWPERARARRAHALLPTGRRLKTVGERKRWAGLSWAGPVGPPGKWTR